MKNKLAIVLLALATGCAIGQAVAPEAHADEETFILALSNDGLPVNASAIALGHEVCGNIVANGVAGVRDEGRMGLNAGLTAKQVADFIVDAVNELCPAGIPAVNALIEQHSGKSGV